MIASFSKYVLNVCCKPGPIPGHGQATVVLLELAFPIAETDRKQFRMVTRALMRIKHGKKAGNGKLGWSGKASPRNDVSKTWGWAGASLETRRMEGGHACREEVGRGGPDREHPKQMSTFHSLIWVFVPSLTSMQGLARSKNC